MAEGKHIAIYSTKHNALEYGSTRMDNSSLGGNTRN